ncbi:hypothetical protein AB5I41_04055 [Sphingomonas sp. MMS24-JH45]
MPHRRRNPAEAEELNIAGEAEIAWSSWRQAEPFCVADYPRELRRRLLRRAIIDVRARRSIVLPAFTDLTNVEPLLDALEAGRAAVQGGVKVTPTPAGWTFAAAPPRRPA